MSSVAPPAASTYAFDDVVVDARAHRVTKAGIEVPLEPKAYDVLLALLREPGGMVSRDALLDAVWGHRHVTPAVLNRVIALLRRALGDDAEHPHLIRTVHGTGYAFIGALAASGEAAAMPAEPAPVAAHAEPVDAVAAAPATGSMRFASVLALILAIAFAATWTIAKRMPAGDPPADVAGAPSDRASSPAAARGAVPATEARMPSFAVLGPDVVADDAADRALAFAYVDGLRDAMARLPGIEVLPRETARLSVLRGVDPAEAARRLDAGHAIKTRFETQPDGRMILDVDLARAHDARVVWTQRFTEPREQLFRTLGAVLDAVQREGATGARRADPVADATPTALDLLARGDIEMGIGGSGAPRRAIASYEQALAVDPKLAAAHVGIASAYREQAMRGEMNFDEAAAKGRLAIARALEIDEGYVPAYVMESLLLTMQWRSSEAAVPLRRARALAPDDPFVLLISANLAGYAGRPREAIALRERLHRSFRLVWVHYALWARDLAGAGRLDEALAKLDEARALSGTAAEGSAGPLLRAEYGAYAEALSGTEAYEGRSLYGRLERASIHLGLGDLDGAERAVADIEPLRPGPPLHAHTMLALRWARGDHEGALAWIEGEGRDTLQMPWRDAFRAHALALAGRRDEARETYRALFADRGNRDLVAQSFYVLTTGLGDIANWAELEGPPDGNEGLAELDARIAALTEGGYALPQLDYYRAMAAALHGDVPAADAALGRAIERGWRYRPALERDLPWRAHRDASWLAAHVRAIEAAIEAERAKVAEAVR